ncbi:MAG: hypothetical protein FWC47_09800 [Oscillospiraceae bacterium]|nr:hypothetical protein [Oscillospiraceae bacterium]
MKNNAVIVDCGIISPFGNDIKSIINEIQSNKNPILTDRFNKIKNFNFYKCGYKTKTYTDRSSQLCVHSVGRTMKDLKIDSFDIGLITASKYGCLESSMKYLNQLRTLKNTWFASPMQFTHSICNMPNSIACIEFGIKGLTNHFVGGPEASLYALWQSVASLNEKIVKQIVVCAFDSISDEHIRLIKLQENSHEIVYSEGAAAVRVKLKDDSKDENILCEIMGIGFDSGDGRLKSLERSISNSMYDAGISPSDVKFYVSNAYLTDYFYRYEKRAVESALYNNIPVIMPKRYIGDSLAASALMSLIVICTEHKLPFKLINSKEDSRICSGDIAVLAGYDNTGGSISICIKIGGKNE